MAHGGFKDISRRNPKYDEYQRVLASVCYTFSEKKKKKTSAVTLKNENVSNHCSCCASISWRTTQTDY